VFVDGYDLLNVIGEGGVGIVYQAVQKSIGRETAVKMIKPGVACNAREKAKFISEAMITGGLDHPNIVPIHDLGTAADGQPFYVMKMVRGTPWDRVIAERSLPENLRILLDVCDAVSFAHCKGVIHRDLKPANVMLGEFGEVQLMDWGLSLSVSEDGTVPAIARSHAAGGTPAYMAPEMVTGDDGPVGFHSDVYLLGAVLYEIATGQPPHAGERVLECLENARWNLIRPTERTGVLVDIALKAMQTSPADRYSSVQDFKQAILDYQAHAESINLCQRSAEHLARARQTRNYEAFAEALFGFREALKLWDGNREAQAGVSQTQWHYARCAFDKSDLDLAASTLDPNYPAHRELAAEVARAQRRRELAKRRLRLFRTAAVSLTAALILIWTVAYVSISAAKRQAEAAREVAVAAQQAEAGQRRLAESAKAEAEEEEKRAVQALADLEKAVKAMVEAQTQEERALAQARAAELVAAETRDELARTGMLMDNSWWVFDQEGARQRQSEAAQSLDMPAELTLTLSNDVELTLVLIPPGDFVMGSPPKEAKRGADEYLHRVTHRRPFYLGRLELTEAQWQAATGQLPRSAAGRTPDPTLPATGSSFDQITSELLPALQKYAPPGWEFRLPTEAQWEYACRAGTATAYYTGDEPDALDAAGWHLFNGDRQVQPVGGKPPNPFGLYDMHGNVGEVCADQYDSGYYLESPTDDPVNASPGERRVVRGGSVFNTREHCRTAYRSYVYRKNQYEFLGLRVALVLLDHPDGDDTP
jgi:formylglycine-generating enzyme required for sulfatase activity/serine/threonine protein kinase